MTNIKYEYIMFQIWWKTIEIGGADHKMNYLWYFDVSVNSLFV